MYAPGLKDKKQTCGVFAIDLKTSQVVGSILWPYGNQIFAVEWINTNVAEGFIPNNNRGTKFKQSIFYSYQV